MQTSTFPKLKGKIKNNHQHRREQPEHRRHSWCCSFSGPTCSPEHLRPNHPSLSTPPSKQPFRRPACQKTELPPKSTHSSLPTSPQSQTSSSSSKMGFRRIISPGRVSPLDESIIPPPDPTTLSCSEVPRSSLADESDGIVKNAVSDEGDMGVFDVRLNLKGKQGVGSLVLELSSEVLAANSVVFADLIANYKRNSSGLCRIEVPDVENLSVFRETIELMFVGDIVPRLIKVGVIRVIDILEVSEGIKFNRGVSSCLKYLEAIPWSEEEEEKLKSLFSKTQFDNAISKDILSRLFSHDSVDIIQSLSRKLVWSITTSVDAKAGNELMSLVKGLLCKSSVYEKGSTILNKDDFFAVYRSCLVSLVSLFEEASGTEKSGLRIEKDKEKPYIDRISKQVENINWVLEILIDYQIAEEMVDIWADQDELLGLHSLVSPMIRYELSRVSASLFIAIGTGKLHCPSEARLALFQAWFGPMLVDFGWLHRCRKGLDMKALEEAMGQALLTLPLKEQYTLFMEWFNCFSKHGTDCPNLSKAFQIWWRRSFLRGSESRAFESG